MSDNSKFPHLYDELCDGMGSLGTVLPEIMGPFSNLHHASGSDGALTGKTKELIALGIAICVRCEGCIAAHVHDAIEQGATRAEIAETVGVAILMGGGPSVVYGCEAMQALEEFTAAAAG